MVSTYILNESQRNAILDYLENRSGPMPSNMRALRFRSKQIDFKQMKYDIDLVKQLINIQMKRGPKPKAGPTTRETIPVLEMKRYYDIAVWLMDLNEWETASQFEDPDMRQISLRELDPIKVWDKKFPYIPKKGEQIVADHKGYEVVDITYDLDEDYIGLLVVKMKSSPP